MRVPDLPDDHPWETAGDMDKLLFVCEDCGVSVPLTASDTQAGIMLYCPECHEEMEYNFDWQNA